MSYRTCVSIIAAAGFAGAAIAQPRHLVGSPLTPPPPGPGFSENFDTLGAGSQLIGQNGFEAWANYPANNPTALVVSSPNSSAPNSCRFALANGAATPATDQTDTVHQFSISGGQWVFSAMTYVPSSATNAAIVSPDPYIMLMRDYQGAAAGSNHWGVQTHFDAIGNQVIEDNWLGGGAGVAGNTFTPQPLVKDQWIPWRAEIDLSAAAGGRVRVYYNNALIADHKWHDQPATNPAPPYTLKALDLYDHGISDFFVDNLTLSSGSTASCYANCDGSTGSVFLTVNDFVCFQSAFAAGSSYANCDGSTSQPTLTVNDFVCFQAAFAAGCSAP